MDNMRKLVSIRCNINDSEKLRVCMKFTELKKITNAIKGVAPLWYHDIEYFSVRYYGIFEGKLTVLRHFTTNPSNLLFW